MPKSWSLFVSLACALPASGAAPYRSVDGQPADAYFGHVSYCERAGDALDPKVVRGAREEPAVVNLPLLPGDRLLTGPARRCEAQFDTGTLMRLDRATSVRLETVLARALSSHDKLTNLLLEAGRVHLLYRDYDSYEIFQVLTPTAAIKLERSAVVEIELLPDGATALRVLRGRAAVLHGPRAEKARRARLTAGTRAVVGADHALSVRTDAGEAPGDEFAAWNRDMNDRFVELHEGRSALPKPLRRYPRAVISFAERFADPYGEWVWSDLYGHAWRPHLADTDGWWPFRLGSWREVEGRMFWVPAEPWGWVPYHLGLWHWDKKRGWAWIPGSAFAPAWVAWSYCADAGYFRPLSLRDWSRAFARRHFAGWSALPCDPSFGWRSADAGGVAPAETPAPQPAAPPAPVTEEGTTSPPRWGPGRTPPELPDDGEPVGRRALRALQTGELPGSAPAPRRVAGDTGPRAGEPVPAAARRGADGPARFRDWNDDVRAARDAGGRIVYQANTVECDGCRRPLLRLDVRDGGVSARASSSNGSGSSAAGEGGGAAAAAAGPGPVDSAGPGSRGEGSQVERIKD